MKTFLPALFVNKAVAASSARTSIYIFDIAPIDGKFSAYQGSEPGMIDFAEIVFVEHGAAENKLTAGSALAAFADSALHTVFCFAGGQDGQAQPSKFAHKKYQF